MGNIIIEEKPVLSKTVKTVIGKNLYIVNVHYKRDGRETAEQKYLRYVTNLVAEELKRETHNET